MSLCHRLIGGIFDRLDVLAPFWQTPREVEWAKAAADGLAEREAEVEVAEPHVPQYVGYVDSDGVTWVERAGVKYDDAMERHHRAVRGLHEAITALVPETSAPTPGAESGPAEGEPPEPSAGVGPNSPKWLRDLIAATEDYVGAPRGSLSSPLESADLAERILARSSPVEPLPLPGAPGAEFGPCECVCLTCSTGDHCDTASRATLPESPAPEFDWVTTAIPVIAGVLAEHEPVRQGRVFGCYSGGELMEPHAEFSDMQDWRNHMSPIIAAALQTPGAATIYNIASGDRPRSLADFPKHQ